MLSVSTQNAPPTRPRTRPLPPSNAGLEVDTFTPSKDKKIWLVHGSHTGGHRSAAKALELALESYPNVDAEVINMADTSSNSTPMSTAAEAALKAGSWVGSIRQWVFDQQFEGNSLVKWVSDKVMNWEGSHQKEFLDRIQREKPDAIVSTMSATNSLLSHWKKSGRVTIPVMSVVTDFASHQMWSQDNIATYYVASPQVKDDLQRFGTPGDRVKVTGIPIREDFGGPSKTPQEARRELGLNPDKPMVLMLGGSMGHGSFEESIKALDGHQGNFQIAAVTGRNQQLENHLKEMDTDHEFTVSGYVSNMPTWLEAADLIITKPGGLTCSEILAKGKPMILQKSETGLEKRLVERLGESGAAVVVDGIEAMGETVSRLLNNPEQLEALSDKAREFGHPDSSERIAYDILGNLGYGNSLTAFHWNHSLS